MFVIDATYLVNDPVCIPNFGNTGAGFSQSTDTNRTDRINKFITRYESIYLKLLLGTELYDSFKTGIAVTPTPLAKWTDLKAKLANATDKISPIANYVFFFYLNPNKLTDGGVVVPKNDDMSQGNTKNLQRIVWNEMVELTEEVYEWLLENSDTYETEEISYPNSKDLRSFINDLDI